MRKLLLIFLLSGLFALAQKSLILGLKTHETLTMKVQRIGCRATDLSNFYVLEVTKTDTCYSLNYKYKTQDILKLISPSDISLLVDFEKNKLSRFCSDGRYNIVTITLNNKVKKFRTEITADDEFLSKYAFEERLPNQ
jgi:hypothetical protein